MMRAVITTGTAVQSARATRRDLLLEILALRHQLGVLARSKRRFRQLTVCCGCFYGGCGPGGGKHLCWYSQPLSIVGIAKASVEAGAFARDVVEDHASMDSVEI